MDHDTNLARCPVCGDDYLQPKIELEDGVTSRCECQRCGSYELDHSLQIAQPWSEIYYLVSAWVRRENRNGRIPFIGEGMTQQEIKSPSSWITRFKQMGFPETLYEKLDALLIALAKSTQGDYQKRLSLFPYMIAEIAAKDINEVEGLTNLLLELGFLKEVGQWGMKIVSVEGWFRVEELQHSSNTTDSAFIAMWFHDTTKKYRNAVVNTVKYCGYKPVILDQEEYNGFIMEQVISQIKQAKFVVADFTCKPELVENGKVKAGVRGGVYWEAGMAYGLNKPVIHTCEDDEDAKSRRHFDIDQYNTIFWKQDELSTQIRDLARKIDNPNFAEKLANRILWVVGRGSFKES